MAYQFTTVPTSPNLYTAYTVNNMDLIKTLNNNNKNWTRKYYKIIWRLKTIANIQLQLQEITNATNIKFANIEIILLQASDIYSIADNI